MKLMIYVSFVVLMSGCSDKVYLNYNLNDKKISVVEKKPCLTLICAE